MFTACIITRDQQEKLEKCLQCLTSFGIPIAVVDTGSEDDSVAVARKYTDNVSHFRWIDDFAAAKNYAVSRAQTDYVMVVDSDEYIEAVDVEELCRQMEKAPHMVGRVKRINGYVTGGEDRENSEWINRIFRKDLFHYEGKIHEQIMANHGGNYETYRSSVIMKHDGYQLTEEERYAKTQRNIRLLETELDAFTRAHEEEDLLSAPPAIQNEGGYLLYQLGKSYYMQGDYATAAEYFEIGLSFDLDVRLEYVVDMVETFGYALLNSGQADKALMLEAVYEEFAAHADFCFLMGMIYMNNQRFDEAVKEFLKATTFPEAKVHGANSYLAYYNAGVIFECQNQIEEALSYYEKAGDYEKAKNRLRLLREG